MLHKQANSIQRWTNGGVDFHSNRIEPPVSRHVKYRNGTCKTIGVASRDGIKFDILPKPEPNNAFVVQVEYVFTHPTRENLIEFVNSHICDNSPELNLIKEYNIHEKPGYLNRGKYQFEYVIFENDLVESGGLVYITDLDLVLSTKGHRSIPFHPYSREAELHKFLDRQKSEVIDNTGGNFIYSINIVDNFGKIGTRWLRIGDDVVKIDPVIDSTRTDGIYVWTNKPQNGRLDESGRFAERYELDQEPPYFKLHKAYHEARYTRQDEDQLKCNEFQAKITKIEADLQLSQNSLEKATMERDNLERQMEIQANDFANKMHQMRMQLEREAQERETMRVKDRYEAASQERKNAAELIKSVPAIILGIIGIVSLFSKETK